MVPVTDQFNGQVHSDSGLNEDNGQLQSDPSPDPTYSDIVSWSGQSLSEGRPIDSLISRRNGNSGYHESSLAIHVNEPRGGDDDSYDDDDNFRQYIKKGTKRFYFFTWVVLKPL